MLGLSEVRKIQDIEWTDTGDFDSEGVRVIYSGGKDCQRGVAILRDRET